jgi:hypothetical protein
LAEEAGTRKVRQFFQIDLSFTNTITAGPTPSKFITCGTSFGSGKALTGSKTLKNIARYGLQNATIAKFIGS